MPPTPTPAASPSPAAGVIRRTIRPAGAEDETRWVLAAAAAIVLTAALGIGLRPPPVEAPPLDAHQIDAGAGLTPAEQGIFADLRAAMPDITALATPGARRPAVDALAAEALPPFVADPSTAARGGHQWRLITTTDGGAAYLGRSAAPEVAGSFLLLPPPTPGAAGGGGERAAVWLTRTAAPAVPDTFDHAALAAAGWREVVATFTAGVTR